MTKREKERIEKHEATIREEEALIARIQDEGAYRYGRRNPRGRQLHVQLRQAESRLQTARRRLRDAKEAVA